MNKHISHQFDSELEGVRAKLMEMGGRVERSVKEALQALVDHDGQRAQQVRDDDSMVNRLEVELDEQCVQIIARRQPAAFDLRTLISIMKASTDLERIGDEACRIAKAAQALSALDLPDHQYGQLTELYDMVARLLAGCLDAVARQDAPQALLLIDSDEAIDDRYKAIVRDMVTLMHNDSAQVERSINIIWAARALERIGDHAKNVCEYVVFLVRGQDVRYGRHDLLATDTSGARRPPS